IELLHKSETDLQEAFGKVALHHADEPDILQTCKLLAGWSGELVALLAPFIKKYGEEKDKEPDRLMHDLFQQPRKGSMGLLRDLHDLWLMAQEGKVCSVLLRQAASALHDKELKEVCNQVEHYAERQAAWLMTRMKSAAPQTLVVG
ncbi:MAG: molybdopterin oxidoreductase, partial [Sphingobacteriales bacterium]